MKNNALVLAALAGLLGGAAVKAAPLSSGAKETAQTQKESCNAKEAKDKKTKTSRDKKSTDKNSCQAKKGSDKNSCSGKSGCKSMPDAV